MLTIRNVQFAAFEQEARHNLEDLVVLHLQEYFPVDYELMGDAQARVVVREGIARAMAHGFDRQGQICRFIGLTLALGSHFDRDPLLPWAADILQSAPGTNVDDAMQRLDDQALEWIGDALGEEGEHFLRGVMRVSTLKYESCEAADESFEDATTHLLKRVNSAKYNAIAAECWPVFFRLLNKVAKEHSIQDTQGRMFLGAVMFMLGSHVVDDPVYPWVREGLSNPQANDAEDAQGRRLYERTRQFIDKALVHLRGNGDALRDAEA